MRLILVAAATLALAACSPAEEPAQPQPGPAIPPPAPMPAPAPVPPRDTAVAGLTFVDAAGTPRARLACRATAPRFEATVPGFRPIGSEDRLSLGADGEAFALAADLQAPGPGVIASGDIDADLLARLARGAMLQAVYGQQSVGPLTANPTAELQAFVQTCRGFGAG